MPSTLKPLDPTQVELEISISPEEFDAAQDAAFRTLSRNAKVPGFRPGKVPRKVFENTYGTSRIVERALDDLVPAKYAAAVEEHKLEPVARPQMELLPESEGQPLRVKAIVPIRPAIEPHDYEGVEITEVAEAATEDDVERTLEQMRRDAATLVPADRPVQLGDVVTLDFAGSIDGEPFEGGTAQGQEAEMTESNFVPGFVEGIVGMRAGESKDVAATFPDPYANAELAGKAAVFAVTVHDVKERELPPLDDEFAARVSSAKTLEELRTDVKRRLDETVKSNARRRMSSELLDKVVALNEVPLPAVLVEREIDSLIADMQQYLARAGIGWDDYLAQASKTADEVRAEYRSEAERRVKTTLLVEAIAKKEGIAATQADVEAELDALAAQYGQPRARIIEALQSNVGALVDGIVRTKTIERMIEQAKRIPATEPASA